MISFIRGTVSFIDENFVILDVHGIGYRVYTPFSEVKEIVIGEEITLNTYFNVREDAMELYGFTDIQTLEAFKMLISVSGIGPKAGMSILSTMSSKELMQAVILSDSKKISSAQGIGQKSAQRIILELKDKVKNEQILPSEFTEETTVSQNTDEAVSALVALGYSTYEAVNAIKKAGVKNTTEETIKAALVALMR